jgi:hypothetical protein
VFNGLRGEVRCCETNLKHNTQKKTGFSYNEMLKFLSFMGSSLASNNNDQTLSSKSSYVGGLSYYTLVL